MKDSNIGQKGAKSIRLDGMKIENLPLGQGNEAKKGLVKYLKTEKDTKRNHIRGKYPKHNLSYLKARLNECHANIERIKNFKVEQKNLITQYRRLIKETQNRDGILAEYSENTPEHKAKRKELCLRYPPYDIDALYAQIVQFEEAIDRCDTVIEQEYASITEIEKILSLVEQREKELKNV